MSRGKFVFELKGNYFGMVGTFNMYIKKYKYCTYIFLSQGPEIFMLGSGGKISWIWHIPQLNLI